jgi:hypothetical protein
MASLPALKREWLGRHYAVTRGSSTARYQQRASVTPSSLPSHDLATAARMSLMNLSSRGQSRVYSAPRASWAFPDFFFDNGVGTISAVSA